MNKELIAASLTDLDEKLIVEAHAYRVKPETPRRKKLIVSSVACACACAVTLCVCLPIALSQPNPTDAPPIDTGTPSENIKPPKPNTDIPPDDSNKTYIEEGFVSGGMGEPVSRLMLAYKINRQFDGDAEDISVQLAFGEYRHSYQNDCGITHVVISVYNNDSEETFVLKQLTAEEFLIPEYDVKIKCTIEENEYGELVTTSETRLFNHEEAFLFPGSMFNKNRGMLSFNIFAFDGDEYVTGSGATVCYAKRDGKIDILTYSEYRQLEQSQQTPPKTDIVITPAQ